MAQIYTRSGGETLLNTTAAGNQRDSVLGALSSGGFVAVWTVFGFGEPLRGQRFDAAGAKLGSEFSITIPAGAIIESASVIGTANGGFVVAWGMYGDATDPSDYNVKAQLFDSAGAKVGGELVLSQSSENGQMLPDLTPVPGGGFLATWMDYVGDGNSSCIKGQLFDAQGAKSGAEFVVNTTVAGQQLSPSAAMLTDGFVVTWQDSVPDGTHNGVAIRAQRFDSNGTKVGAELLVSTPGGAQIEPEVAGLAGGGFVVVWEHRGTGNVQGQVYDSAGAPVGGQFTVNTSTFSEQSQPAVAALPWGGFVVSWTDFSGAAGDSNGAVRAQIFEASGAKSGTEFLVNLVTASDQQEPDLTVLTSGAFVASWTSKAALGGDGAGDGIKAQIFTPGGPGLGTIDYSADSGPVAVNLTASLFLFPAGHPHASRSLNPGEALDGSGNYEIVAGIQNFILTAGNDRLVGSEAANRVEAGAGNDNVDAAGGNDVIFGQAGNDRLSGDVGNDQVDGGDNDDSLAGWAGQDVLTGGDGSDQLYSHGVDNDFTGFFTSPGISYDIYAEVDTLTGGAGSDYLFAGVGDHVDGGADDGFGDRLYISFRGATSGVNADFRLLSAAQPITVAGGTITGIEAVDFIEGSEFDDLLASHAPAYPFGARVYGRGGNDHLIAPFGAGFGGGGFWGGDGNDTIDASATPYGPAQYGEAGDDILIGGWGFGKLDGGEGNDIIRGGSNFDTIFGGGGNDSIDAGSGADDIEGGEGNDTIYGGSGDDEIDGGGGDDLIYGDVNLDGSVESDPMFFDRIKGGAGADTIYGNSSYDLLEGGEGNDLLYGGEDDDTLEGGAGNDLLDGGIGSDTLRGGADDDVYLIGAGDVVEENSGEGTDEIRTSLATYSLAALPNVENLTGLSATGQTLTGNSGNNAVTAGNGNDVLRLNDGGNDTVNAGGGNDNIFFIGALTSADVVNGGAGVDTLVLQGPYGALTLTASVTQIENVSILGGNNTNFGEPGTNRYDYVVTTHDSNFAAGVQARVNGSALLEGEDFTFDGSAETDASFVVYGGKGVDTLTGGLGNDIFFYAEERFASGDTVNGGAGYDGMFLRGNYVIDFNAPGYTGLFTNIENLTLTSATDERYARGGGTEFDYNLTLSDAIVGAGQELTVSGALLMVTETMVLDGSQETDGRLRLFGGKSADTLKGGGQADLLHGNLGADVLSGGGGADAFRYQNVLESNAPSRDHIIDFTPGTDRIELDRIDANRNVAGDQAFTWIGSNAFTGSAGELRAFQSGGQWIVQGDINGDGFADLVIALTLQGPTPLGAGDFLL